MTGVEVLTIAAFGLVAMSAVLLAYTFSPKKNPNQVDENSPLGLLTVEVSNIGDKISNVEGALQELGGELSEVKDNVGDLSAEVADFHSRLPRRIGGRYDLMHIVGRGAVGVVWRAIDTETGIPVAVKLLRPGITNPRTRMRFLREADVAQLLDHPNIVRTYDSGEDTSGALYLVMELLDGRTLRDVIFRRTYDAGSDTGLVYQVGCAVIDALIAAREAKIVHRDIKPENICMPAIGAAPGGVQLADFGLGFVTSISSSAKRMTEEGVISGTPHYMSPEQCRGLVDLTSATDIYSLGCVLYELVVGEPPFSGPSVQAIMLAHCHTSRPHLPGHPQLARLIRAMMAIEPDDRPTPEVAREALLSAQRGDTL